MNADEQPAQDDDGEGEYEAPEEGEQYGSRNSYTPGPANDDDDGYGIQR
jgi:hypothetical protein